MTQMKEAEYSDLYLVVAVEVMRSGHTHFRGKADGIVAVLEYFLKRFFSSVNPLGTFVIKQSTMYVCLFPDYSAPYLY